MAGQHARANNPDRAVFDLYPTPKDFIHELFVHEDFRNPIWEPAAGLGDITNMARTQGYEVFESDVVPRRYGQEQIDFVNEPERRGKKGKYDFITNPPFKLLNEFIEIMVEECAQKVACVIPLAALCGETRLEHIWRKRRPKIILLNPRYLKIYKPETNEVINSQFYHAWAVWDRSWDWTRHDTALYWIDPPCRGYERK